MKYLSNINRPHNCWILFEKEWASSYIFMCYFFLCAQQLKITKLPMRENFESTRKNFGHAKCPQKKFQTYKIRKRKNRGPTKYEREKIGTHEILTKKYFGLTKYPGRPTMTRNLWNLAHSLFSELLNY